MARTALFVLLTLPSLTPRIAGAQDGYLELYARHARAQAYLNATVLPSDDGAAALFTVRVPNSRLVFVREREPVSGAPFVARVEISVEVRAGSDVVRERIWQTDHTADDYESSARREIDLEARLPIDLPPGPYTYRLQVRDVNASEVVAALVDRLEVPDFEAGDFGRPVAVRSRPGEGRELVLSNLGGDVAFEGQDAFVIPVRQTGTRRGIAPSLTYTLWQVPAPASVRERRASPPSRGQGWDIPEALEMDLSTATRIEEATIAHDEWIAFAPSADLREPENGAIIPLDWTASETFLVPVSLDAISDRSGSFVLEVKQASGGSRLHPFSFHWKDMPVALHDAQTAIRMLSWIEEPARIRAMLRGSRAEREQSILSYWQARDPSPGTPYNELMAEYYRRIDHAAVAFRTGAGPIPNGLRTDQARIYIVHGPPEGVDRTFPPTGGVEETWTYGDGRRFVFWAASSLDPLALIDSSGR